MTVGSWRRLAGWAGVGLSTTVTSFWAFWGIVENFHEGWYYTSLVGNLVLMFGQYLIVMLGFLTLSLAAVKWPRAGAAVHVAAGLFALWFFRGPGTFTVILPFITGPFVLLGALYAFGRPEPRRRARTVLVGVPLLTLIACGIYPAWVTATRVDDGDRGARVVEVDDVRLLWAPAGPGWPETAASWDEATRRCRHLSEDGRSLTDAPQEIWRLPTVEEAVASQHRHGKWSGGRWDPERRIAVYATRPDKEPPLWNPHSPIIYWWTATSVGDARAYRVVYNGMVNTLPKQAGSGSLSFRCVSEPRSQ
jgi:hypothetical protein